MAVSLISDPPFVSTIESRLVIGRALTAPSSHHIINIYVLVAHSSVFSGLAKLLQLTSHLVHAWQI